MGRRSPAAKQRPTRKASRTEGDRRTSKVADNLINPTDRLIHSKSRLSLAALGLRKDVREPNKWRSGGGSARKLRLLMRIPRPAQESVARREGFADLLRSLVESAPAETLTEVRDLRRLSPWRAGRDSRAAFGCEGFATRSVARNPLGRCAPTRHSLIARDSPSGSKKNPNPRKINDLRSNDRHIAAQSGISRHPGRHSTPKTAPRRH
jgi:hypothetical protein